MVDLIAKTPCAGLLPQTIGALELTELDLGPMTSIAPYKGQSKTASEALKTAHQVALPKPNRTTSKDGVTAIWFGLDQALLVGAAPDSMLANYASLTNQSDSWAVVQLKGAGAADALARLVSIDLRASHFKRGHTARCDLMHMMASVTKTGADSFQIMVFRSMAQTLVHDLTRAMQAISARDIA